MILAIDFLEVYDRIKGFISEIINILFAIPKFVGNFIVLLPHEIQVAIGSILAIICIALIYRFIR